MSLENFINQIVNNVKPQCTKLLNLKSDKSNEFIVEFYIYEDKLFFEAYTKNLCPKKEYIKIYSYKDIQNIKFFSICENIKQVYEEILNQIKEKDEQIILIEKANLLNLTIKECTFIIDEIPKDINTKIDDIYSHINILLNEIKDLKEKNIILEEKNKKLEEKIEEYDKILLLFKEKIDKKKKKEEDLKIVKEWIAPGKNITLNLLFKKSRDGNTSKDFHDFCDDKGKTLTLIETEEGRKFGEFSMKVGIHILVGTQLKMILFFH